MAEVPVADEANTLALLKPVVQVFSLQVEAFAEEWKEAELC